DDPGLYRHPELVSRYERAEGPSIYAPLVYLDVARAEVEAELDVDIARRGVTTAEAEHARRRGLAGRDLDVSAPGGELLRGHRSRVAPALGRGLGETVARDPHAHRRRPRDGLRRGRRAGRVVVEDGSLGLPPRDRRLVRAREVHEERLVRLGHRVSHDGHGD